MMDDVNILYEICKYLRRNDLARLHGKLSVYWQVPLNYFRNIQKKRARRRILGFLRPGETVGEGVSRVVGEGKLRYYKLKEEVDFLTNAGDFDAPFWTKEELQDYLDVANPSERRLEAFVSSGRQTPMALLERIKEDFTKKYSGGKAATAVASSLNKEFGPKLKEQMQYCVDHPEEISKFAKVKAQVSEVKGVMMENIEKVLDRGEKIELLVDKTKNLRSQAQDFRTQGTKMRRKMWLQNMKIKLIVLGIIIALILIIVLSVCGGFNCGKHN